MLSTLSSDRRRPRFRVFTGVLVAAGLTAAGWKTVAVVDTTGADAAASSCDRITWRGRDSLNAFHVWVADADGGCRVKISDVDPVPDPTANSVPRWRPRAGALSLGSTTTALVVGQPTTVTVTVTSTCVHGSVVVVGIAAMGCLGSSGVAVSHGSLAGTTWNVGTLNGTATAAPPTTVPAKVDPASCLAPADPVTDVSGSSFARADVTCIFNLGITTGTGATTYDPAGKVSREQMAGLSGPTLARRHRLSKPWPYP